MVCKGYYSFKSLESLIELSYGYLPSLICLLRKHIGLWNSSPVLVVQVVLTAVCQSPICLPVFVYVMAFNPNSKLELLWGINQQLALKHLIRRCSNLM